LFAFKLTGSQWGEDIVLRVARAVEEINPVDPPADAVLW
jgi:hypothetical protein